MNRIDPDSLELVEATSGTTSERGVADVLVPAALYVVSLDGSAASSYGFELHPDESCGFCVQLEPIATSVSVNDQLPDDQPDAAAST
jgi:hypothetical protein